MQKNYNNNQDILPPFKKGRMQDIVKPTKRKVRRLRHASNKAAADTLYLDLVQVFSNYGIQLSKVHSMAMDLVKRGWEKTKRIENLEDRT